MNEEIEKNINSYLVYGSVVKGIIILATVIATIFCFMDESTAMFGIIILIGGMISAFVSAMIIKWFGYALKCLYDIKNSTAHTYSIGNRVEIKQAITKCANCGNIVNMGENYCHHCGNQIINNN